MKRITGIQASTLPASKQATANAYVDSSASFLLVSRIAFLEPYAMGVSSFMRATGKGG